MFRIVACAMAALALTATAATAAEYTDANNTFRLKMPDDWTTERPPIETVAVVIVSPRRVETGGNCNVVLAPVEATKSMSQAEIEADLSGQFNEEYWKAEFRGAGGFKSTTIEKHGERMQHGRKVFFVKATSEFVAGDITLFITQLVDYHAIPGRVYAVSCTVRQTGFEREVADFEMIMTSFEPIPYMTVAAGRTSAPSRVAGPSRAPAIVQAVTKTSSDALEVGAARSAVR
jgi:hypothetical protein